MNNITGANNSVTATEEDFGVTDRTTQVQIAKKTFRLSDTQAEGLIDYVGFTTRRLPEVLCQKVPGLQVRRMSRRDYGRVGGAVCDLGHQVRYLWTIACGAEDAATAQERHFGTTCAEHAMGLTQAEITLVKSLDRWTLDLAKREMLRTLGQSVAGGRDGGEMWSRYTTSQVFTSLSTALGHVKGNEHLAVAAMPPAVISSRQDKRRLQALGRICTAVETAEFLIEHNLPVPFRFRQWIEKAAKRIARSSRRNGAAAHTPAPASTTATAGQSSGGVQDDLSVVGLPACGALTGSNQVVNPGALASVQATTGSLFDLHVDQQ